MKEFIKIVIKDGHVTKNRFRAWLSIDDVLNDNPRSCLSFSPSEFADSSNRYDKKFLFNDDIFSVLGTESVFGIGSNKMFLYCLVEDEDSALNHLVKEYGILLNRAKSYYQNELTKINEAIGVVNINSQC